VSIELVKVKGGVLVQMLVQFTMSVETWTMVD
jgi:hypothetical protein